MLEIVGANDYVQFLPEDLSRKSLRVYCPFPLNYKDTYEVIIWNLKSENKSNERANLALREMAK